MKTKDIPFFVWFMLGLVLLNVIPLLFDHRWGGMYMVSFLILAGVALVSHSFSGHGVKDAFIPVFSWVILFFWGLVAFASLPIAFMLKPDAFGAFLVVSEILCFAGSLLLLHFNRSSINIFVIVFAAQLIVILGLMPFERQKNGFIFILLYPCVSGLSALYCRHVLRLQKAQEVG